MHTGGLYGVRPGLPSPRRPGSRPPRLEHHARSPESRRAALTQRCSSEPGATSPARRDSDHLGVELTVRPGCALVPLVASYEHAVVALGPGLSAAGRQLGQGHLGYLGVGRDELTIEAVQATQVLLIGREPFDEQLLMWWNYVARSRDEIIEAHQQWSVC